MVTRKPVSGKSKCNLSRTAALDEKPLETTQSNDLLDGLSSKLFRGSFINPIPVKFNVRAANFRKTVFFGSRSRRVTLSVSSAVWSDQAGKTCAAANIENA